MAVTRDPNKISPRSWHHIRLSRNQSHWKYSHLFILPRYWESKAASIAAATSRIWLRMLTVHHTFPIVCGAGQRLPFLFHLIRDFLGPPKSIRYDMIPDDIIMCAEKLNLPHRNHQLKSGKTEKLESKKMRMLRSIGKRSSESGESVLKKKRKATMGRICRKGSFLAWNERARGWQNTANNKYIR